MGEADRYLSGVREAVVGDLVPREKVSKQGVRAVFGIGGGVGLFLAATLVGWIPLVGGIAGTLMNLGGFGLLAWGGFNGFQFIRNLRRRS